MTDTSTTDEGYTTVQWVCIGRVRDKNNKLHIVFQDIDRDDLGENRHSFENDRKYFKLVFAGEVYSILFNGAKIRGEMQHVCSWHDISQRVAWQIAERAEIAAQQLENKVKKAGDVKEIIKSLKPLRTAYRRTDRYGRMAIELLMLDYLRGYGDD